LRTCGRCSARQEEIAAALDDDEPAWRDRAAALSAEHLEAQRRAILDRLPSPGRSPARVVPFAPRAGGPALAPAKAGHWRLAAAAAILAMVGAAGAGWVIETERHDQLRAAGTDRRALEPVRRPDPSQSQEALLSDIEMALANPGTPELRALDALTPQGPETPGRR
jgi:hypothetical protein